MAFEGGREAFYENEKHIESVDVRLEEQIENVKKAIYDKIVIGSMPNDSNQSQKTDNAIFYEYIMRRLCLDLDPSINASNMVPIDELPETNKLIRALKNDEKIGSLIDLLIKTYRALSKSENAKHNASLIQQALIVFPWPYKQEDE